jgi:cobalamin synthase
VARDRDEWMRRLGPLYPGVVALRQTTAVRWPAILDTAGDDRTRSAPWMVGLGAAIGACAWSAAWLVGWLGAPPALGGAIALAVVAALGAAVVETGTARRCDGWWPGTGPLAVALLVTLRATALLSTAPAAWAGVLIAAPLVGRWSALVVQRTGADGAGRRDLIVGPVSWFVLGAVTVAVVVAASALAGAGGFVGVLLAGGAAVGLSARLRHREGGLGPDVLALAAATGELAVLLCAAVDHAAALSPFVLVITSSGSSP